MPPISADNLKAILAAIESLSQRVERLSEKVTSEASQLRKEANEDRESTRKDIANIDELLKGNGEPEKGIIVRLDRLSQSYGAIKWWFGAVSTALMGIILKIIFGQK